MDTRIALRDEAQPYHGSPRAASDGIRIRPVLWDSIHGIPKLQAKSGFAELESHCASFAADSRAGIPESALDVGFTKGQPSESHKHPHPSGFAAPKRGSVTDK